MSGIIQATNRKRGFARLGPEADPVYKGIRTLLVQRGYEHELHGANIWVRYLPRRMGGFPLQYARILATHPANPAGGWNTAWAGNVDKRYDQMGQIATLAECRKLVADAAGDPDFRFLHWLDAALMLCPRADRQTFLGTDYLAAFSARFPNGRVMFIGTDYDFETRLPILRHGSFH